MLQDARYERALQGLRLLARHHVGRLVQTLIDWRTEVNEDIKRTCTQPNGAVNLQGVCKRVRHMTAAQQWLAPSGGHLTWLGNSAAAAGQCRGGGEPANSA